MLLLYGGIVARSYRMVLVLEPYQQDFFQSELFIFLFYFFNI